MSAWLQSITGAVRLGRACGAARSTGGGRGGPAAEPSPVRYQMTDGFISGGGSRGGNGGSLCVHVCQAQHHTPLVSDLHHPQPLHRRGILCVNCGPRTAADFQEPQQQNSTECFLVFYTVISGQKKCSGPAFPCRFPKRPSLCLWHQDVFA
ncbi:hypothetical protein SKAU_G00399430 [Synaphobranchus kaupii]|uniref:Uncharacterized protein n=1 Tax=Synaphobranchus kaupii TaxID=118154 RepID=A0A9Q1IC66_SYNKA|nr:hypothetical protein SKAU_G00399430 [Synaphobranchus kaupii]